MNFGCKEKEFAGKGHCFTDLMARLKVKAEQKVLVTFISTFSYDQCFAENAIAGARRTMAGNFSDCRLSVNHSLL